MDGRRGPAPSPWWLLPHGAAIALSRHTTPILPVTVAKSLPPAGPDHGHPSC